MAALSYGGPEPGLSMRIYVKNNPAKFHPDPIWNDGALGFSDGRPNKKQNNNRTSSDKGPVPDPEVWQKGNMQMRGLPDDDDDEIQRVPAVAQVGARVKEKPVGDDLHDRF